MIGLAAGYGTGVSVFRAPAVVERGPAPRVSVSGAVPAGRESAREPVAEVLPPTGESWAEVIARLEPDAEGKAPPLDITGWKLGPVESLRALHTLLRELQDTRGMELPTAVAWTARRLAAGNDTLSLAALAGEVADSPEATRKTLALLAGEERAGWFRFSRGLCAQFAVRDPGAGARWLEELARVEHEKTGHYGSSAQSGLTLGFSKEVMDRLLEKGADHAVDTLNGLNADLPLTAVLKNDYYAAMAREDPEELWEAISWSGPGTAADGSSALQPFLALATARPAFAAGRLEQVALSPEERGEAEKLLLHAWVRASPEASFRWMLEHRGRWTSAAPMSAIFTEWARTDTLRATSALAQMPPGADRDDAIGAAVRILADTEPAAARQWVSQITDSAAREAAAKDLKP